MKTAKLRLITTILIVAVLILTPLLLTNCTSKEQEGIAEEEAPDEEGIVPGKEETPEEEITPEESDSLVSSVDSNFISSNTEFGFNIFKELALEDKGKNIFISPLSILSALTMTYNGAEGGTASAMEEALKFNGFDSSSINKNFSSLIKGIKSADTDIEIEIANSIWYRPGYDVREEFIEKNKKYFDSEVSEIDFSSPDAPRTINSWIEEKTKGKIDKMIDRIPPDVVMYLINAIYFKGDWTYPFDENLTGEDNFYLEDGTTKEVPMMWQKKEFSYYAEDSLSAIKLPYGKEKMSMYIILPGKGISIDTVVESLNVDKWNSIKESFATREVSLTMPKYKMEYGIKSLKDALTSLGMGIAFDSELADFSGICKPGETPCFISDVLHKAVIEVNEKGSEAAAATVVEMRATAAMPAEEIVEFTVDRPFFFMIIDERTGSILFMGKVMEPGVVEP